MSLLNPHIKSCQFQLNFVIQFKKYKNKLNNQIPIPTSIFKIFPSQMNRYKILQEIGHGAYSIVYKAMDLVSGAVVAIKRINHTNSDINNVLKREIRMLQTLQHPNIIKLVGLYNDQVYTNLVFEYLPFDLITYYKDVKKNKRRNLNDDEITYIVLQMCQALAYMHQRGIMHRDIKPQNVLIDPTTLCIKLIDFGFATPITPYAQNTQYMITRWYRPLQIVLNLPYDFKADIFALGALLLQLYQGQQIFRSSSNIDQLYWILQICGYPSGWTQAVVRMQQLGVSFNSKKTPQIYKMTEKLRPEAENIIIGMLQACPLTRLNINQILEHPYFSLYAQPKLKLSLNQNNNSNGTNSDYTRQLSTRYRTNSNNFEQTYKSPQPMFRSIQNYYSNNHQNKSNNYYNINNQTKNSLDLNLNLHKYDFKKQNVTTAQLSTERSKNSNGQYYLTNHRRLSENFKWDKEENINNRQQLKFQRNDSYDYGDYGYSYEPVPEKGRYRTEGNEKTQKKYYPYSNYNSNEKNYEGSDSRYKFLQKYMKKDYNNQEVEKSLKNRTKSYQSGISVISQKINDLKQQLTPRTNYQRNYYNNQHDLSSARKKQPTFAKIRDKFAANSNGNYGSKGNGKIKISLTDRNQFYIDKRTCGVNYA